jgi:hypothetical protein
MRRWKTAIFAVFAAAPLVTVLNVGTAAQASSAVSASPAYAQHQATTLSLSPAQCQAAKAALARTDPAAAPMKKCEVGIGIALSPVGASPALAGWYTYTLKTTACWGAGAYWGDKNGSFSCAEGFIQMTYQFATNGSWLNLHWIDPNSGTSPTFSLTKTWQGVGGNNTSNMAVGVNWNWGDLLGSGTVELRAYNKPCGGFKVCATAVAYWHGT